MPWSPSFADAVPDPRLDPYRGRAAELVLDGTVAGHVLVETDYSAEQHGGTLWWRRWAEPAEFAIVLTKLEGHEAETAGISPDDVALFDHWAAEGFSDAGTTYAVVWLGDAESARVHDEVFAHQH